MAIRVGFVLGGENYSWGQGRKVNPNTTIYGRGW